MTARIIDGKTISQEVRGEWKRRADALKARGITPGLAVIIVGEDPASKVYVGNKIKACAELGIYSEHLELPADTTEAELLAQIARLNADPKIHGFLVQLPVPRHIDSNKVLLAISPNKDVDGFHPMNVGETVTGTPHFQPCTPLGVMKLLEKSGVEIEGKHAVVVGRSNIVGKPMALMLLQKNATGHHLHLEDCRPRQVHARCRYSGGRHRQAADDHRRHDQARRSSDRRRHQPPAQRQAGRRCGFRQRQGSCGLDHTSAWRCWADDHHHAGSQHGDGCGTQQQITPDYNPSCY